MMKQKILLSITSCFVVVFQLCAQTIWYVSNSGDDGNDGSQLAPWASIKFAVGNGNVLDGDVIKIEPGVYTESDITIEKSITLKGENPGTTFVQAFAESPDVSEATTTSRVFTLSTSDSEDIILSNLTIRNGNIAASGGGGIVVRAGVNLHLESCNVISCSATGTGGGILVYGTLTATNSSVVGNYTGSSGGGIFNGGGDVNLTNCLLFKNVASAHGGAIQNAQNSTFSLLNNTIVFNSANISNKRYGVHCEGSGITAQLIKNNLFYNRGVDKAPDCSVNGSSTPYAGLDAADRANNVFSLVYDANLTSEAAQSYLWGDDEAVISAGMDLGDTVRLVSGLYDVALGVGSVAIDAGASNGLTSDMHKRSYVGTADVGASEYGAEFVHIWDGTEWTYGIQPEEATSVTFEGDYSMIANLSSSSVAIETGATLTVESGVSLTSLESLSNEGVVLIQSGGSLITTGTVSGTNFEFLRTTSFDEVTGKYSVVGSPVSGATTAVLGSLVYAYDASVAYGGDGSSRFQEVTSPAAMSAGDAYFSAFTGEVSFSGTPNSGQIDKSLIYNESNDGGVANAGFNLVSNPYPCAIDRDAFVAANSNINGAIYLWDDGGSDVGQRSNSDYITVNDLGVAGGGSSRLADWNGSIGSAQGFFVKANTAGTLSFTDAMKVSGNNDDQNFFRRASESKSTLKLAIKGGNHSHETLIGFVGDATTGVDRLYDAPQIGSSKLSISSLIDDASYVIQGLPDLSQPVTVPLSVHLDVEGSYTISLDDVVQMEGWNIYLIDHELNKSILLSEASSYTFHSSAALESKTRFSLSVTNSILGNPILQSKAFDVNIDENGILIKSGLSSDKLEQGSVQVLDVSGKSLMRTDFGANGNDIQIHCEFDRNKIYLVRISTSTQSYSEKFVIQ